VTRRCGVCCGGGAGQAPVFAVDASLRIIQWNNMCEKLTGYRKSDVLGTPILSIAGRSCRKTLDSVLRQALVGDEARSVNVSVTKCKAEELPEIARQVDLLLNAACSFDVSGNVVAVHCVCQDVTSHRITMDSQDVLSAQLQHIVKLANQQQPNFLDATESQFEFYPDKEQALLGEGAFGKTYKMQNKMDNELYAVKMIKVKKMQKDGIAVEALKREVHMLLQLNCQYIVRYYTCFMRKQGKYFCIVMELADGGTITNVVKQHAEQRLSEDQLAKYLAMMASALEHIHSKRMLHRDLKPDNVLLSAGGNEVKVTDFGLACVASSESSAGQWRVGSVQSRAGTLTYASPEKASSKPYDSKDDMWALGCVMSELITGVSLIKRCAGGVMAFNAELTERVVNECQSACGKLGSIMAQLLSHKAEQRPSAGQVLAQLDSASGVPRTLRDAAQELCEEYLCAVCSSLVVDAQSACSDEHLMCLLCFQGRALTSALACVLLAVCRACVRAAGGVPMLTACCPPPDVMERDKKCPACKQEMSASKVKTQRVVNNMADKLAKRLLTADDMARRASRQQASKAARACLKQDTKDAVVAGGHAKTRLPWATCTGAAHLGSACTVLRHGGTGSVVEVFHVNGWFRFRQNASAVTKWCNSCCVIGDSDFGAPALVQLVDANLGVLVEEDGIAELNESEFWSCKLQSDKLVLDNVDDETLVLLSDGAIVWLSHQVPPSLLALALMMAGDAVRGRDGPVACELSGLFLSTGYEQGAGGGAHASPGWRCCRCHDKTGGTQFPRRRYCRGSSFLLNRHGTAHRATPRTKLMTR